MIDLEFFLTHLGLTEKESLLYITSLKYGSKTASTLAVKTGMARSTINFLFKELIKKGFASKERRENTTYYFATQPESLEYMLQEKKAQAKKLENDFKTILPFLKGLQGESYSVPKVCYYEGLNGLYHTIDDCCAEDQTVRFISSHNNMHPKIREYVEKVYVSKSRKHQNKNKMILNQGPEAEVYVNRNKDVYDEVIMVDPAKNPFRLTTAIYGAKTAFISYDPEDMSGIIIDNKLLAEQMTAIFEALKRAHANLPN